MSEFVWHCRKCGAPVRKGRDFYWKNMCEDCALKSEKRPAARNFILMCRDMWEERKINDEAYAFANKWLNYPDDEWEVIDLAIALQDVLESYKK